MVFVVMFIVCLAALVMMHLARRK